MENQQGQSTADSQSKIEPNVPNQNYPQSTNQGGQATTTYQTPMQQPFMIQTSATVSVGDWLLTFFLMMIPIVNIILLFVWAFSNDPKVSRKNWAVATLVIYAILFVLSLIFFLTFAGFSSLSR